MVDRMRSELPRRLPVSPDDVMAIRALYQERAPDYLPRRSSQRIKVYDHVFDLLGPALSHWGGSSIGIGISRADIAGIPYDAFSTWRMAIRPASTSRFRGSFPGGSIWYLLAQTALLTGEPKYAIECVAQMTGWMASNPPGDGSIGPARWMWLFVRSTGSGPWLSIESPAVTMPG